MLDTPAAPAATTPDLVGDWGGFPLSVAPSQDALVIILALVAVFSAALSVMLIYHWRRFPFERELFRRVEQAYLSGVVVLLGAAIVGILLT